MRTMSQASHWAVVPTHRPALRFSMLLTFLAPRALLLVHFLTVSWLLVPKMMALRW